VLTGLLSLKTGLRTSRSASMVAVKVLVTEPISNSVCRVGVSSLPRRVVP
jgi:hypothetical protein